MNFYWKNKKQKNRKKDRGTEAPGPSKAEKQILSDFLSRMTAPIPVEELEVRAGKVYHSPSLPDGVRNMYQPGVDVAFCKPCKELVMRYQPQD